jgi:hypothetical protein
MMALTAVACGDQAKGPTSKAGQFESRSSKAGPDEVMMAAALGSALADDNMTKTIASIEPGQTVAGLLNSGDNQLDDGSFYDAWLFELSSPAEIQIAMSSTEVDSYLSLYQGHPGRLGTHMGSDDDSGGMPNARLAGEIPAGAYTIMANSFGAEETGAYELTFMLGGSGSGSTAGGSSASGSSSGSSSSAVLRPGSTSSGSLSASDPAFDDGSYFDEWTLSGQGGERVTVTMTSDEIDSYLIAFRGSSVAGGEYITEDDDSGGALNAQITMTLPASGTYTFAANTFAGGETGAYDISVVAEAAGAGSATFATGGTSDGKYALLVGIDDYPGTGSDLRGPVEDARIMYRALTERFGFDPQNIVVLNDSDATRDNIANGIVQHLGQAGPDGTAVFFYSGHGTQIGRNIGLTGALDPEPRGDGDEAIYIYGYDQESSVLLDEELGFLIETIDAGKSLVVVDACFSGEITRGAGDAPQSKIVDINDPEVAASIRLPTNFIGSELKAAGELPDLSLFFGDLASIERAFQQPQRHIMWGSSTEEQVSWTSGLGNNASVFTYYVGEALMSAPLTSSFRDLAGPVHDNTMEYIRNNDMTDQNPQMRGDNASMTLGEFFGVR